MSTTCICEPYHHVFKNSQAVRLDLTLRSESTLNVQILLGVTGAPWKKKSHLVSTPKSISPRDFYLVCNQPSLGINAKAFSLAILCKLSSSSP